MTYNLTTAKILHRVGRHVVVKDSRQYTVCTDDGQPINLLGGGKRGLAEAICSADLSADLAQAWGM
jgi:hypothetical protein